AGPPPGGAAPGGGGAGGGAGGAQRGEGAPSQGKRWGVWRGRGPAPRRAPQGKEVFGRGASPPLRVLPVRATPGVGKGSLNRDATRSRPKPPVTGAVLFHPFEAGLFAHPAPAHDLVAYEALERSALRRRPRHRAGLRELLHP